MELVMPSVDERYYPASRAALFYRNKKFGTAMTEEGIFRREMHAHLFRKLRYVEGIMRIQGKREFDEVIERLSGLNDFYHQIMPRALPTFSKALNTLSICSSVCVAM